MGDDTDLSDILAYLQETQPSLFSATAAVASEGEATAAIFQPPPKQLDKLIVLMLQYSPSMRTELRQQLAQQLTPLLGTQVVVDRFHKQLQAYDMWTTLGDEKKPTKRQWLIEQARLWLSTTNNDVDEQVNADEEDVDVDAATFQRLYYQAERRQMMAPSGVLVVRAKVRPQILYGGQVV